MNKLLRNAASRLLLCCLGAAFVSSSQAATPELDTPFTLKSKPDATQSEYAEWVKRYATKTPNWPGLGLNSVKVVLTTVEDEERTLAQRSQKGNRFFDVPNKYVYSVFADGRTDSTFYSTFSVGGGPGPKISFPNLVRLEQLLSQLPDDKGHFPPPGRRLLVEVGNAAGRLRARVYDRANAPQLVLEILRLTGSGIRSWVPYSGATSEWTAYKSSYGGGLTVSSDKRLVVSSSTYGPLLFWNPDTRELVKTVTPSRDIFVTGISSNPDGSVILLEGMFPTSFLNVQTGQVTGDYQEEIPAGQSTEVPGFPHFTPDGRFLLLQNTKSPLRVLDEKTFKRVETPPDLPRGATAYVPAPGTSRALYVSKTGSLGLWDSKQQREIATLDGSTHLQRVAFSPDRSMVAASTFDKGPDDFWAKSHIRIWNTNTGALVHELRLFEQNAGQGVDGLLWSPDGRYVLAAASALDDMRYIGAWNVRSGRQRATLWGFTSSRVTGLALLADGRLVAGCDDGMVRLWNTNDVLKEMDAFETSFSAAN